jgi:branched-chain amino acid aminotransferase
MHEYACFNREIIEASKIRLPAASAAVFYGRGVFTTVAVYNSKPFQWSKHWLRLMENAKIIGVDLSEIAENQIAGALSEIIGFNRVKQGRARISIFDLSAGGIWNIKSQRQNAFLITTADFRPTPSSCRLTVSPYPINSKSPLAGIKSCNYLENLLALEEAHNRGYDEAIRLNEKGEAASASMANVFWVRGEEIFTSSLETGALAGTTRSFILENFRVREKKASLEELKKADEIFLTSAGLGVVRAESFEERNFTLSNIFPRILDSFEQAVYKIS